MTEEQSFMAANFEDTEERKRNEGLWWAGALIWAGLVFAADSLGYLPEVGEAGAWSWVFLGAGLYGLLLDFYALIDEDRPKPRTFDWIWSSGLSVIGLAGFIALDLLWPLILVVAGGAILFNLYWRR
jgi:hypothetical protein